MKFLILFVVIPLLELYVMIAVGTEIGALSVVLWTVLSAILGVAMIRHQGLATMQNAQLQMQSGETPEASVFDGVLMFIGGLMVMLPGLITDFFGLLILIPPVRQFLLEKSLSGIKMRAKYRYQNGSQVYEGEWQESKEKNPAVLEGEVVSSVDDKDSTNHRPKDH